MPRTLAAILIALIIGTIGCERDSTTGEENAQAVSADRASKTEKTPEESPAEPAGARSPLEPPSEEPPEAEADPTPPEAAAEEAEARPEQGFDCGKERTRIKQRIAELDRSCTNDDDCILESFGCPFGCGTIVRVEAKVDEVDALVETYRAHCPECRYRCRAPGPPKCVDNTCTTGDRKR